MKADAMTEDEKKFLKPMNISLLGKTCMNAIKFIQANFLNV